MAARALPRLFLEALLVAVLLATFTRSFLLQGILIPGGSMQPTLLAGDLVLVNKLIFNLPHSRVAAILPSRAPRRRDVILFRHPSESGTLLVKRATALAGDRVSDRDGRVVVEPAPSDNRAPAGAPADSQSHSVEVPAGHLYVLGDNRADSLDSRILGPIDEQLVLGKVFLVSWSFDWQETPTAENGPRSTRWRSLGLQTRWHRIFSRVQ